MNPVMRSPVKSDAPGDIHHAIIRGIDRTEIFRDNRDRDDMMDRHGHLFQNHYKSIICQEDISKPVSDMNRLNRYKYCGQGVLILTEANERMDRRYELKSLDYDLDRLEQRVLDFYQITKLY